MHAQSKAHSRANTATTGVARHAKRRAAGSSKAIADCSVLTQVKHEPSFISLSSDEGAGVTERGSPAFAREGWTTRFIPTLIHCLASASDPWDIGNGSSMIVTIQGVIDVVYPGSGYQVKYGDKIHSKVRLV